MSDEVNPLMPDGIENVQLHCTVCTAVVPERRASTRSASTCSKECAAVLKAKKRWNYVNRRCPMCCHPSTPEQRKEFLAWRRSKGERQGRTGRPPVKRTLLLEGALRDVITAAKGAGMAADDEILRRAQNVLDAKGTGGVTLAASGQTTTTAVSADAQGES